MTVEKLEGGRYQVSLRICGLKARKVLPSIEQPVLAGYVVLDPQLRVEEMFTGRPPQAVPKRK